MKNWNDLYLIRTEFEITRSIGNLDLFHGVYWNAVLREWLKLYTNIDLSKLGIIPLPYANCLCYYHKGDCINLDLIFPDSALPYVRKIIADMEEGNYPQVFPEYSQFYPGKTLIFKRAFCLKSATGNPAEWQTISATDIAAEASSLQEKPELELIFHTPLRFKRPEGKKTVGHTFMDSSFFSLEVLFKDLGERLNVTIDPKEMESIKIIDSGLIWADMHYSKTLGGIMGGLLLKNNLSRNLLTILTAGQYLGLGKNNSFGFGFYRISQSPGIRNTPADACCLNLKQRAADIGQLKTCLENMKYSSAGPDSLTKEDLEREGLPYLNAISRMILRDDYLPGDTLIFRKRTSSGSYRTIKVQNIGERHLCYTINEVLSQPLDKLLYAGSFAYRRGKNYHSAAEEVYKFFRSGFTGGIKSDISSFFDSIVVSKLILTLKGLTNLDPITSLIASIFPAEKGIAQGNPLSPLLSNLYLTPFDLEIAGRGYKYIRYGDDFCLLTVSGDQALPDIAHLEETLKPLGLKLSSDKTFYFTNRDKLTFCGYEIGRSGFKPVKTVSRPEQPVYNLPLYYDEIKKGRPVYITFRTTYVHAERMELIVKADEKTVRIPFSEISRIVVIGKPRISAGVIHKALIQKKPVVFITVWGYPLGGFYLSRKLFRLNELYNPLLKTWEDWCLDYVKTIAQTKLHHQRLLLKQHNIDEAKLRELENTISECSDADSVRGKEGYASTLYWAHFRALVKPLEFEKREYHPPSGPVNALLSIGYTMLYNRVAECILAENVNPYEGIFHSGYGLHFALASDLMEVFRYLSDRIVLTLIHKKQITEDSFIRSGSPDNKYCRLSSSGMQAFIRRFELTLSSTLKYQKEELTYSLLIDETVRKLVRCMRLGLPFRPYRAG